MNWNDPKYVRGMQATVERRRLNFKDLPQEQTRAAAHRLDVGCQFLLSISDWERYCMTDKEWVDTALANVRRGGRTD